MLSVTADKRRGRRIAKSLRQNGRYVCYVRLETGHDSHLPHESELADSTLDFLHLVLNQTESINYKKFLGLKHHITTAGIAKARQVFNSSRRQDRLLQAREHTQAH